MTAPNPPTFPAAMGGKSRNRPPSSLRKWTPGAAAQATTSRPSASYTALGVAPGPADGETTPGLGVGVAEDGGAEVPSANQPRSDVVSARAPGQRRSGCNADAVGEVATARPEARGADGEGFAGAGPQAAVRLPRAKKTKRRHGDEARAMTDEQTVCASRRQDYVSSLTARLN
ncbi:MAG TPA: hypothetical protein VM694_04790 [Polyangium sp.]|nr:hypothetical protein [Polyangium sp.]